MDIYYLNKPDKTDPMNETRLLCVKTKRFGFAIKWLHGVILQIPKFIVQRI